MTTKTDQLMFGDGTPLKRLRQGTDEADVQSGDLQGLSHAETADSESVADLVAEGQSFEAGAVSGVEEAGDFPVREVTTRQVSEDDVPLEYLTGDR